MSNTKAKRHTHKYRKINSGSQKLWACALSDCTHIMPKHYEENLEGKNSICWECEDIFPLDKEAMEMDRPTCFKCRHPELNTNSFNDDPIVAELLKGKL